MFVIPKLIVGLVKKINVMKMSVSGISLGYWSVIQRRNIDTHISYFLVSLFGAVVLSCGMYAICCIQRHQTGNPANKGPEYKKRDVIKR